MEPHQGQPVRTRGPGLDQARGAMVMIHGRNAGAANILELAALLPHPSFTFIAPEAAGGTWYPQSFLSETARNQPGLSSGLAVIGGLIEGIERQIPSSRVVLLGFSQGACLAGEYAIRHPARYGGIVMLSGGLIGPPGTTWGSAGRFEETPVFLGCSDVDPHIPKQRVDESAAAFSRMGARVTERIYRGMGHQVNDDELEFVRELMEAVAGQNG